MRTRRLVSILGSGLLLVATPVHALDLEFLSVETGALRTDGTSDTAYTFDVSAGGVDLTSATVTPSGGAPIPLTCDAGECEFNSMSFASPSDLRDAFPAGVEYLFSFNGGADSIGVFYSGITFPSGFIDITLPNEGGATSSMPTFAWTCDGCVGEGLKLDLNDLTTDADIFEGEQFPVGGGSFPSPEPLIAGHEYRLTTELYNDSGMGVTTVNGDAFFLLDEFAHQTEVFFTVVPEPGSAGLVACGFAALGVARRVRRSRSGASASL